MNSERLLKLSVENSSAKGETRIFIQKPRGSRQTLLSIDRGDLLAKLAKHGAVLLRDFVTDADEFSKLVSLITPKTAIDPARAFFSKNVQLVNSGVSEMGLHCENGTTPLVPQIVWFYCERAATTGSQTTLCDGVEVWELLSPRAKSLLLSHKVRFSRNVKNELWIKYVKHHFPHLASESNIDQKMLDDIFNHIPGSEVRLNPDGSLFLSYATFAAHSTFFGDKIAFANSIFGPSFNYEAPTICFENGEPLPDWLLLEARTKTDVLTSEIPWISGDIILIDNSRVMHGRRHITDLSRKIFTALGFLSVEDKALVLSGPSNEEVYL